MEWVNCAGFSIVLLGFAFLWISVFLDICVFLIMLRYGFKKDIGDNMHAEFLMIDTVLLVGESFHDIENNIFVSATGPKNLQRAQSQWTWLETRMRDSTADFLFVVGHYPVYSPCCTDLYMRKEVKLVYPKDTQSRILRILEHICLKV